MGQTQPKPVKPVVKEVTSSKNTFAVLPPVPHTEDMWRKGNGAGNFNDRDMEALKEFRQLEIESLESDDEKESKIREFCNKYIYAGIPLDVDRFGYMRWFDVCECGTRDIDGEELEEHGESLIVYIGQESYSMSNTYLSGNGILYKNDCMDWGPLKVIFYNYKDTGIKSSHLYQNLIDIG